VGPRCVREPDLVHPHVATALPAYAAVQGDPVRLKRAFVEALEVTALVSIAFAGFVWAITPDFVRLVLGNEWIDAIPIMRILAIWGAIEAASEIPIAMFEAVGRPGLATRRLLVKTVLPGRSDMALDVGLGSGWGIVRSAHQCLPRPSVGALRCPSHRGARSREIIIALGVPALGAALAAAGGYALSTIFTPGSIVSLVVVSLMFVAVVVAFYAAAARLGYHGPKRLWGRVRGAAAR